MHVSQRDALLPGLSLQWTSSQCFGHSFYAAYNKTYLVVDHDSPKIKTLNLASSGRENAWHLYKVSSDQDGRQWNASRIGCFHLFNRHALRCSKEGRMTLNGQRVGKMQATVSPSWSQVSWVPMSVLLKERVLLCVLVSWPFQPQALWEKHGLRFLGKNMGMICVTGLKMFQHTCVYMNFQSIHYVYIIYCSNLCKANT